MKNKKLEIIVFSTLFLVLSIITFFVFKPFLSILVLAIVLSVLFHPLNAKLVEVFHGNKNLVACLLVIVAFLFLIVPILFFGLQFFGQAQDFFSLSQVGQGQYMQAFQYNINTVIQHIVPTFSFSISDTIGKILTYISDNLGVLLSQTAYIFFQISMLLFAFFFFLRDGERMLKNFVSLSPFEGDHNKEILNSVYRTITSVVRGTLFVGLIRLILFVTAFYLFGIPNALLWGSLAGIIGIIPGLGTPFVIAPSFLYLFFYGNVFLAIGMGVFGILIIFFVDNLLSTYFFGKGLDVPSLFILFSIFGGVILFGPLGFIFGPIILSLFISAVDTYKILLSQKSSS